MDKESPESFEFQYLTLGMELEEGQGFGELALMNKKAEKRAASVIAESLEGVCVAVLDKEDFQKVIMV